MINPVLEINVKNMEIIYNLSMNENEKIKYIDELLKKLKDGASEEEVKDEFIKKFGIDEFNLLYKKNTITENKTDLIYNSNFDRSNPLVIFAEENGALKALIDNIRIDLDSFDEIGKRMLIDEFDRLKQIKLHYLKKEEVLFPYLEKYQVSSLDVVKEKDDLILKSIFSLNESFKKETPYNYVKQINDVIGLILDSVSYENKYLLVILDDNLSIDELYEITNKFNDIGYCLIRV